MDQNYFVFRGKIYKQLWAIHCRVSYDANPFLDKMGMKDKPNLEFDIYRKPSLTNRLITSDSFHNHSHKMEALHSIAHRMVSLPLNAAKYDTEKNHIIE